MSRLRSSVAAAALLCWILPAGLAAAQARGKGPAEAYLAAAAAVRRARGFDPILPYLSAQYRSDIEGQDVEGRKSFFGYFKDSLSQTELVILKETIDGDTAMLEVTGKDAAGRSILGEIQMVREDGGWRLDDYAWETPE
jgi:hypothetical protein